jgi:hypothetical protein
LAEIDAKYNRHKDVSWLSSLLYFTFTVWNQKDDSRGCLGIYQIVWSSTVFFYQQKRASVQKAVSASNQASTVSDFYSQYDKYLWGCYRKLDSEEVTNLKLF